MSGTKVVVGVDGSLASLEALRHAVAEARQRSAELTVVHVLGHEVRLAMSTQDEEQAGRKHASRFFADAMGGRPDDVVIREYLRIGDAVDVLRRTASGDGDLLVLGAARPRRPWRIRPSVTRGCLGRATCSVLVVPPPRLARELTGRRRRRWRELDELLATGAGQGDPRRSTR